MADFSAAAPVETTKQGEYLHDRMNRPSVPPLRGKALALRYLSPALGFALSMGAIALAFQTRAGWSSHRDWVVPVTAPLLVAGAIAAGYLISRRQWAPIAPAAGLLLVAAVLTGLNIWRGAVTEGQDNLRDAMSIVTGVVLGLAVVASAGALVWVEWKHPTRPPSPGG